MNKRIGTGAIFAAMVLCLWLGLRSRGSHEPAAGMVGNAAGPSSVDVADHTDDAGPLRTKASSRPVGAPQATHGPQRLREFMLPETDVTGLDLEAALRKLMDAYEVACAKSGETPLPITFSIDPKARPRKLAFHLPAGDFNSSVRLLATLAGMKVSRDGREFRFEALAEGGKQVSREFLVPPDFNSMLSRMAGVTTEPGDDPFDDSFPFLPMTLEDRLKTLGMDLDPTTHLQMDFAGRLRLETASAADAAAIAEIAKLLSKSPPKQLKFNPVVLELSTGADWVPPDISHMTEPEVQRVMRDLAQIAGTDLQTLPSITAKTGQVGRIEVVREFIYPADDSGETMETRDVGKVMNVKGKLLGFGQEVSVKYTDTTVDTATGKPVFDERTSMSDEGFSTDSGSRLVVQTRPDGSRTVMLLRATMIDATGRPIH